MTDLNANWRPPGWTLELHELGWALHMALVGVFVGLLRPPAAFLAGAFAGVAAYMLPLVWNDDAIQGYLTSRLGTASALRDGIVVGLGAVAGTQILRSSNNKLQRTRGVASERADG
jgi:hypothetical protein